MRILILGANGMLGHAIHRSLGAAGITAVGAVRRLDDLPVDRLEYRLVPDAENMAQYERCFDDLRPNVVINALGIVKQSRRAENVASMFKINALFPRWLQFMAQAKNFKLIHFSTDCVFSGRLGMYKEDDFPDPVDMYGLSKALGEVYGGNVLTFRTSIIGRGITPNDSLVDWFLGQHGSVKGFRRAIFSGVPVGAIGSMLAEKLEEVILLSGIYNLAASPINKFELLHLVRDVFDARDIDLVADDEFVIDRSLDGTKFAREVKFSFPSWPVLIRDCFEFYGSRHV